MIVLRVLIVLAFALVCYQAGALWDEWQQSKRGGS